VANRGLPRVQQKQSYKGRAAQIAVLQPTKFELVINLAAAPRARPESAG